jgi:hypothetical protein
VRADPSLRPIIAYSDAPADTRQPFQSREDADLLREHWLWILLASSPPKPLSACSMRNPDLRILDEPQHSIGDRLRITMNIVLLKGSA